MMTTALNFWVQGLTQQRHLGRSSFIFSSPTIDNSLSPTQLRHLLRCKRKSLTQKQQKIAARGVYKQLASQLTFLKAKHIAFYLANDGEISPHHLLSLAKKQKKHIYLPVLYLWPKHTMAFQRITSANQWITNRFNIIEPKNNKKKQTHPLQLDIVLTPLVGFDPQGHRIGMGGGYYDRYFTYLKRYQQWKKPLLIGLAHHCQQVHSIKQNSWDVPMDTIITDKKQYHFKQKGNSL